MDGHGTSCLDPYRLKLPLSFGSFGDGHLAARDGASMVPS